MLVMLADKHTRNVCSLSAPSDHEARGVLAQDALARTPLWSTMMKQYLSANGHRDLKQADGNDSGRLALDYPADEGWRWKEDIQAWADPHHILSPMGFKLQKQNPPNLPRQDSPVPSLPRKQTLRQPTPGPSGTQWSEELFREPSQTKEPPIPGPSPSSQPHEDDTTPFPHPSFDHLQLVPPLPAPSLSSTIRPLDPPLHSNASSPPVQSPSHSHNDACQEFNDLQPTLMIPRAIVHKSINQILLEHHRLLHMIPFVDATH
ncbi:hypothetical protein O181_124239 [Austropuccinia psidii MF-1]|uniref:Uncharacterized protein n=1 Tax=Austropuccinia psidii MF-1 TaxID=1389203 RepID=A0A9Q3Q419_9BASI|nr:hypothetical protein [Austropuccinia psidii MF-1]